MVKAFFSPMTLAVMGLFMMTAVVIHASEQESGQMEKKANVTTLPKPSDVQPESNDKKGTDATTKKDS